MGNILYTIPFQPDLPEEGVYGELERMFVIESPVGLWPTNQNSNFGLTRQVVLSPGQDAVDTLTELFNEMFVDTAVRLLSQHEYEMGLPDGEGLSVGQRRARIKSRKKKTPFTRTRRREVVEEFIIATFGDPAAFGPEGISLAGGIPLYGETIDPSAAYSIRENVGLGVSGDILFSANFETAIGSWIAETGSTVTRSADKAKWGGWAAKVVTPGSAANEGIDLPAASGPSLAAGQTYTISAYVNKATAGSTFRLRAIRGATDVTTAAITFVGGWQKISLQITPAATGTVRILIDRGAVTLAGTFYVDGVMVEKGSVASDYIDSAKTAFYYEVRILSSHAVDVAALTRELTWMTPAGIRFDIFQPATL